MDYMHINGLISKSIHYNLEKKEKGIVLGNISTALGGIRYLIGTNTTALGDIR